MRGPISGCRNMIVSTKMWVKQDKLTTFCAAMNHFNIINYIIYVHLLTWNIVRDLIFYFKKEFEIGAI